MSKDDFSADKVALQKDLWDSRDPKPGVATLLLKKFRIASDIFFFLAVGLQ